MNDIGKLRFDLGGPAHCTSEPTVAMLVERATRAWPNAVALRDGRAVLTYRDLNARANRLAAQLRSIGAEPGSLIAICLVRCFDHVAATLAVMKIGATFLPIDLAWPDRRIRDVLDASGADVLIGCSVLGRVPEHPVTLLVDRDAVVIAACDPNDQPNVSAPGDLAYVIYTSGSTGTPKGVEVTQGNLANFVAWHADALRITPADRSAFVAGLGFDASVWDVWPYLVAGASATLAGDLVRTSPELLQRWMINEGITVAFVTTVLAEPMLAMAWPPETALRILLTGGTRCGHGRRPACRSASSTATGRPSAPSS